MKTTRIIFTLFVIALSTVGFCQKLEAELGYKFNNDFTIYYKDLKPFYYSGATVDLLWKYKRSEFILGGRYMPFLSSFKPEIGYNYYPDRDPEQKFNYFLHTTLFINNYSYNSKYGYENYKYIISEIKPQGYTSIRFTSIVHDIAFGVKMGFTPRWAMDFIAGGGYFYGRRDYVEGLLKEKTKENYFGIQYNFRFALKYIIYEPQKKEEDE